MYSQFKTFKKEILILELSAEDKEGLVICSAAPSIMKQKQRLAASEYI